MNIRTEVEIMKIVEFRRRSSGGHCGVSPNEVVQKSGIPWGEVREALNSLYRQGKIISRDGQHGQLIFRKLKNGKQ